MISWNRGANAMQARASCNEQGGKLARVRLAGEIFSGGYRPGQSLKVSEIATQYDLDEDLVLRTFAEFQTLGMVTLLGESSAIVQSPKPKETQEAYEIQGAWRDTPRPGDAGLPPHPARAAYYPPGGVLQLHPRLPLRAHKIGVENDRRRLGIRGNPSSRHRSNAEAARTASA